MEEKRALLKRYFGHAAFRGGQEALIDAILSGRDVLGVMPTGGGKSVCYQLPALLLPGLTVVVSPLISLMKDQVAALTEAGIPAAFLNSSLSFEQLRSTYAKASAGQYKLLYVAPERLETESFLSLTARVPVSLLAVDEAHCISQWGQDFRPSYLKIAAFLSALPHRPVIAAFTATATAQVRADIIGHLGLANPLCNITGFDRPNLYFEVLHPNSKLAKTLELVQARAGKAGIVYCATRAGVERVCEFLCDRGIAATRYHAGLSEEERRENQDDFRFDRKSVMVATNAFGMGIDKSNVSFVIHYNMPKSLEAYYQEAGRAGRDGQPARCTLLYSGTDVRTIRFFIDKEREADNGLPADVKAEAARKAEERLKYMTFYSTTQHCLRGFLLQYFGEAAPKKCGNCSCCLAAEQEAQLQVEYARRRAAQSADRLEKPRRAKPAAGSLSEADEKLLNALYAVRKRLAGKQNLPAFMVFNDATLREMAEKKPMSIDELLNISGVGEKKAARYGNAFLRVIEDAVGSRE